MQRGLTHRGQCAGRDSRALQERPPVQFRRCFIGRCIEKPGTLRTTFGLPGQHGSLLSSGIAVDAIEIPDFLGVRSIASPPLLIAINGFCGSRRRQQLAGTQRAGTDNRQPKQVASKKLWRLIILQRSTLPVGLGLPEGYPSFAPDINHRPALHNLQERPCTQLCARVTATSGQSSSTSLLSAVRLRRLSCELETAKQRADRLPDR
ncbi:hypothetical protein BJS_05140 [Bradyrhizobium japonicum SEMIA 5079]|nr:hypothetical protein BJS_05140 [Bradyrhizobium japonicum SEMIA 5079]